MKITGFVLLGIGLLGILTATGFQKFGLGLFVGCGSVAAGAFFGFLFSIPRVLQGKPKADNGTDDQKIGSLIASNTNLEQISDWLTAIIIGASLVQLHQISTGLDWIAKEIAKGMAINGVVPAHGYAFGYFAIIYFFIGGFLFTYLFTRLHLVKALSAVEKSLADGSIVENADTQKSFLVEQLTNIISLSNSSSEMIKSLKTGSNEEDPNAGKFGGKNSVSGLLLSAKIHPIKKSDVTYCQVDLVVSGSIENPLIGIVRFYLHPTFKPNDIIEVKAVNNRAELTFISWGAFVVGAEVDYGAIHLELNLADPALGGPSEWRKQ